MPEPQPFDRSKPLHGRDLRHAALVVLDRWGPASIGDVLATLAAGEFCVYDGIGEGKARKRLADALRHEVRRGRARRVGWGRYAIDRLAATTRWRIHRRWDDAAAATLDERGSPVVDTSELDAGHPTIPWTLHDRRGDPIWINRGRWRWQIGRHVLTVLLGRSRATRVTRVTRITRVTRATVPRNPRLAQSP